MSGEETSSLRLWFDTNRDGQSQPGEVRSLESAGISSLGYSIDKRDERLGNLYSFNGYEQVKGDHRSSGVSVDWFARTGATKTELLAAMMASGGSVESFAPQKDTHDSTDMKFALGRAWQWKEESKDRNRAGGVLYIEQSQGKIRGYAALEMPPTPEMNKKYGVAHVVERYSLQGTIERRGDAELLSFVVSHGDSETATTAEINAGKIKGVSSLMMTTPETSEKIEDYRYEWQGNEIDLSESK